MQAIIITAYKDYNQLCKLIDLFKGKFYLYIHIDKKSDIMNKEIDKLKSDKIYIISKYNITWGSINHLYAIIDLIEMALENEVTYIHTISAQDFPIKKIKYFYELFSQENNNIYMSLTEQNNFSEGLKERYEYYNLFQRFNGNKFVKYFSFVSMKLQKMFRIKRKQIGEFNKIYKGMIWISLPYEVSKYIVHYAQNNTKFMNDLYLCKIPEEFFFQTIIMNSKYSQNVVTDNLRFTDWTRRNDSCPAFLDISDYDKINESKCIFARKMHPVISNELIDKIYTDILIIGD